jgi:hypothetical protein
MLDKRTIHGIVGAHLRFVVSWSRKSSRQQPNGSVDKWNPRCQETPGTLERLSTQTGPTKQRRCTYGLAKQKQWLF